MSIQATTEPMFFPGSGTWKNVPIESYFGPGIIDHYPEGPGETRPFEQRFPPFISDPGPRWGEPGHEPWQRFPGPLTLPLPNPTPRQVDPREIFNPFGFPEGLAGRYMNSMGGSPVWAGALGNLIGAGIKLFKRK